MGMWFRETWQSKLSVILPKGIFNVMSRKPPVLPWGSPSCRYYIQSEHVRGEQRNYWAEERGESRFLVWSGPGRKTQRAAEIDAEYHAVGRREDRPECYCFGF
jgi:hypothetical protein